MTVDDSARRKGRGKRIRATRTFLHKAPTQTRAHILPKQSVYYWWYECLRRNEEYRRCCKSGGSGRLAGLYADFGNVFAGTFRDWWDTDGRGEHLFAEPLAPMRLQELRSVDEWDTEWTRDAVVVVAVPLNEPKRRIKRWFDRLLKHRHTGKRGHPTKTKSDALYKVKAKFSAMALEQMLLVYDYKQANPTMKLADIGYRLKLVSSAMPEPGLSDMHKAKRRNVMTATVSRYLLRADAIIRNATDRRKAFPCAD